MAISYSPKRLVQSLPGLYPKSSLPTVDPTFFSPHQASVFRPYLWDLVNRAFLTEQGKQIALLRAADAIVDSIYGKAIETDAAVGQIFDHGVDLDAQVGASWSMTFVIMPKWDAQPTAESHWFPFFLETGPNPRFGYREDTGVIEAQQWWGNTSASRVGINYTLGWKPHELIVATLVSDNTTPKTELWVNGVLRGSLSESVKANLSGTLRARRWVTQTGVTGKTRLEAYFIHQTPLTSAQVQTLHKMFRTGFTTDSRWVRTFMAMGMAFAELEALLWKFNLHRSIDDAAGGSLVNLGKDFGVSRRAGETDSSLRERVRNKALTFFSQASINEMVEIAARTTGLLSTEITIQLNKDENGADVNAAFVVQLPPGNASLLTALLDGLEAAKGAGVKVRVGTTGSFAYGVENAGYGFGAYNFVR